MNGSVYLIKNSANGKVYVGQTIQPVERRFKQHLKLPKASQKQLIYKAIQKYGKDKFSYEILIEGIDNYKDLNELEEFYITKYNSMIPNGYNMCPGGQKWRRVPKLSPEQLTGVPAMYEKGMSSREIGAFYNIGHQAILKTLKRNNIAVRERNEKLPDRTSKLTKEIMEELYIEKRMKMKDIAELLNVNVATVNRAKRRYNLKRI